MIEVKSNDDLTTKRIKTCINKKGFESQKEFCRSFDPPITESLLSDIFSGKRRTIDKMCMLANAFDCSLDYLVGLSPIEKREWDDMDRASALIQEKTGLSSEAFNNLAYVLRDEAYRKHINDILEDFTMLVGTLEEYRSFIEYNPVEEDIDDKFGRKERQKALLDKLNEQLISYKNRLPATIDAAKRLKSFYQRKMEELDDKRLLLEKEGFIGDSQKTHEYFQINYKKIELNSKLNDVRIVLMINEIEDVQ